MRRAALILVAILLASCATAPEKVVEIQTVETTVPVRVPCDQKVPDQPTFANEGVDLSKLDIFDLSKLVVAVVDQHIGYEADLRAVAIGCTQ